jgi:quinol monooxygenase YgiN
VTTSGGPELAALRPLLPAGLPDDRRPMIALVDSLPGHEDELRAAVAALTRGCRAERGCLEFTPYEDALRPGRFHLIEVYASTAAFEEHLDTPHVQEFWRTLLTSSSNHDASNLTQLVEVDV